MSVESFLSRLGAARVATLQAHGAAMTLTDAVAYLHAEATRVLTDS